MKRVMLLLTLVLLAGCVNMPEPAVPSTGKVVQEAPRPQGVVQEMTGDTVKAGDTVRVDYLGTLRDGTVFDTSMESKAREAGLFNPQRAYEPIEFVVGAGQMIQGFDEAVVGMKSGEKKTVTLPPEKAYGERSEDLMQEVPTEDLKLSGIKPEEGTQLMTSAGPARVTSTNEDVTVLDFNHELAGETLIFEITLVSKE